MLDDEPEAADVVIRISAEHRGVELLHAPPGVSVLIDNCGIWCWLVEPGAANTDERRSAAQVKRDAIETALLGAAVHNGKSFIRLNANHAAHLANIILKAGAI